MEGLMTLRIDFYHVSPYYSKLRITFPEISNIESIREGKLLEYKTDY